jgi:cell division protease FtsH
VDERHTLSKQWLLDRITIEMGGRAAEMIVFGHLTTGAKGDIDMATSKARKMVCEWGLSEELGPLAFGQAQEQIFLGRELSQHRDYSEETAILIDKEVRRIVDECYERAESLLRENRSKLNLLAEALVERELLTGDEAKTILEDGKLPEKRRSPRRRRRPRSDGPDESPIAVDDAAARRKQEAAGRAQPERGESPAPAAREKTERSGTLPDPPKP